MPVNYLPAAAEYVRVLPEILLTLVGTLLMFLEAVTSDNKKGIFAPLSIAGLAAALGGTFAAYSDPGLAFQNMVTVDGFATFFRALVIGVGLLAILSSTDYLRRENARGGEFYALILFSIAGQSIMASANELITIFIGIEISSIASYILAGYLRDDPRNNESALKYFLLGSFATAFLLYGVAWIYGATGSTNLIEIRRALLNGNEPLALVSTAAALIFVGIAFKISAAPFQSWAPDVYEGAPTPVAAFLSAGPKAAAFAILIRVFLTAFGPIASTWTPLVWGVALANIGAFAVVTYFGRKGEKYVKVDDFAGLAQRQPAMAAMLTIFLLSLIGVPLTGGFFGKFYIFKAALDANLVWLTVLGLLNSAVAAYYYLRILVVMYFREPGESAENLPPAGGALRLAVYASALGTLLLGIFPSWILDFASKVALR